MKFVIFLVIFMLSSAFLIISNENLHLGNSSELNKFTGSYYNWVFKTFGNLKSFTGYVIKLDWLP